MKKIGILGGVGPQATAYIYSHVIDYSTNYHGAVNNDDYPYIVIASVPVPDFISNTDNIDTAKTMLIEAAKGLVQSGCEILCIGSNTVHVLLADIRAEVHAPFISMIELVATECKNRNYTKVALLGTPVLLNSGLYDNELNKHDIGILKPSEQQEAVCDTVIRNIIAGQSIEDIKGEYVEVLNAMFSAGADGIILGCTELPMVLNYEALGSRIISSDDLLARGVADYFYQSTLVSDSTSSS